MSHKDNRKLQKSILEKRKKIDQIDRQILRLCRGRVHLSLQIFDLKAALQTAVVDPERENVILSRYLKGLNKFSEPARVQSFVQSLIGLSRGYPGPKRRRSRKKH